MEVEREYGVFPWDLIGRYELERYSAVWISLIGVGLFTTRLFQQLGHCPVKEKEDLEIFDRPGHSFAGHL